MGLFNVVEGNVFLTDDEGTPLATISGTDGPELKVQTDVDLTISGGETLPVEITNIPLPVEEQNLDSEGYINNSAHNFGKIGANWSPFTLTSDGRLRIDIESSPHTLSGTQHTGQLADEQIPDYITRDSELNTVSGVLQADIDAHTGDSTIHFLESDISHLNIQDIGTTTHSGIDDHIADGDIHFPWSDVEDEIATLSGSLGITLQLEWKFSTITTSGDPGNGRFRFDNSTLASVTNIYLDDFTESGVDAGTIIGLLQSGDKIYIQQEDDSSRAVLFTITAAPTDNTGWWTIPVSVDSSNTLMQNNKNCAFVFVMSTGLTSVDWGDIGGTLSDQTDLQGELDNISTTINTTSGTLQDGIDDNTDYTTSVSGSLQEQFTDWRRLHLAATGDLGTGGKWADLGNIYDVPVVIFNDNKVEQMVMMFRVVGNIHPGENPQIVIATSSVDIAPQAGDAARWLIEFTFIAYGDSLGIPPDITVSGTQTLDNDPSYLAIETRNTDLIFPITGFDLGPRLDSLVFMKVTRLGTDSLDTFNGDIALSEIWLVYYGT